jgi:hypothetical protein
MPSLESIPKTVAVQNFPILVQLLCHVMCVHSRTPGFKAFRVLLKILNLVHWATREKGALRSRLLQSFVYHAFDPGAFADQVRTTNDRPTPPHNRSTLGLTPFRFDSCRWRCARTSSRSLRARSTLTRART